MNRRTFLAGGLKAGAVLVGATAVDAVVGATQSGPASATRSAAPAPAGAAPGSPTALTVIGVTEPVGVDPDAVLFAWHVGDTRRGARQNAYRIVVVGPGGSNSTVWDSGTVPSARQAFVPYNGPKLKADARYRWTVSTADAAGHWSNPSLPATFTTGLREADWTAQWLRPGPADPGLEEYTYVRASKTLPSGTIAFATAYVAAAHKYHLWVNGKKLDSGPSFCFPDEQYWQATDITKAMVPGKSNAIGILHHWYGPGQGHPASAPGLLAQVAVHYTDGTVVTLASDATWQSRQAEWLAAPQRNNDVGDFVEWIDGQLAPIGWSEPTFDDRVWQPVAVRGPVGTAPFTHLFAQRTRITEPTVRAVSLRTLPTGSVIADFGKVYAGRPTVSFAHGTAGHTVPMHVGYTLDPDGSVCTTHNNQQTDLSFIYIERAGAQAFDPYTYLGFRYLQIDDPGEVLHLDQIALVARHATMPDVPTASFASSNSTLDAVWDLCAHSGLYASQEQFVDTPTREKGQFLWDSANESQTVMRTYGDQNLSWQGLRDMARAQERYWPTGQMNEVYPNDDGAQNYPTFSALYPEWVWRYYLSTGDDTTATGLLPNLIRLSDYLARIIDPATGLISKQPLSTNGENYYHYDYATNADTTLNVLAVNAFNRIADIATLAVGGRNVAIPRQRAAALTNAVNTHLVRSDGLYVDGIRSDGSQSAHASQLANLTALAYGVVPSARIAAVAKYVASQNISVAPDHGMELLRALHAGGRDADIVRVLTDASFPGWAAILKAGGTFTWESWTPSDLIGDSMSHGWGSSALVAMQEAILGAVASAPAPDGPPTMLTITTPTVGLTHASGAFPTPAGRCSVAWANTTAGTTLSIVIPPNAAARCQFPGATIARLTEGGVPVARAAGVSVVGSAGDTVIVDVGAGSYEFTVAPH